jgi:cell division control protein 45
MVFISARETRGASHTRPTHPPFPINPFWGLYCASSLLCFIWCLELTGFSSINRLREALLLSMALHRAIIRQGSSIIDKQDIKTMRGHRVVVLTQGPDLALFAHPGVLSRLALWLVDALRDRTPGTVLSGSRSKRKSLPFVVACLDERAGTYVVVGVTAAMDFGDTRKK